MVAIISDRYGITSWGGTPHRWRLRGGERAFEVPAPRDVDCGVLRAAAAWLLDGTSDLNALDSLSDAQLIQLHAAIDHAQPVLEDA